jgi:hypothetical protein
MVENMNEEKKLVWVMNLKDSVGMVGFMVNICCCQPQVKKLSYFETKFDRACFRCNFKSNRRKNNTKSMLFQKRRNAMAGISRIFYYKKVLLSYTL